jgi:hypothetical protein
MGDGRAGRRVSPTTDSAAFHLFLIHLVEHECSHLVTGKLVWAGRGTRFRVPALLLIRSIAALSRVP